MEHGAVSPENLKEVCFIVGRAFGVRNLGRMLYEITVIASEAGQVKSKFGGVCSISFERWKLMTAHHQFYEFRNELIDSFGIDLKRIQFPELAKNPQLSVMVAAAWLLANVGSIPKKRTGRADVYRKHWRSISVSQYMFKTEYLK